MSVRTARVIVFIISATSCSEDHLDRNAQAWDISSQAADMYDEQDSFQKLDDSSWEDTGNENQLCGYHPHLDAVIEGGPCQLFEECVSRNLGDECRQRCEGGSCTASPDVCVSDTPYTCVLSDDEDIYGLGTWQPGEGCCTNHIADIALSNVQVTKLSGISREKQIEDMFCYDVNPDEIDFEINFVVENNGNIGAFIECSTLWFIVPDENYVIEQDTTLYNAKLIEIVPDEFEYYLDVGESRSIVSKGWIEDFAFGPNSYTTTCSSLFSVSCRAISGIGEHSDRFPIDLEPRAYSLECSQIDDAPFVGKPKLTERECSASTNRYQLWLDFEEYAE